MPLWSLKSISIPCVPTTQSIGLFAFSNWTSKDTSQFKFLISSIDIGLNLESLKAEIKVYFIRFFSKLSLAKVPTHPLNSFYFPVVQVTNNG